MYNSVQVDQKEVWENYISTRHEANFLQSWNWGVFHASLGKHVFYYHFYEDDQIIGCALIISEKAKRGHYLTVAGGPLLEWSSSKIDAHFEFFLSEMKALAQVESSLFLRLRLQELQTPDLQQKMAKHGLLLAPMHLTADLTIQLDLHKDEQTLLNEMRKNTRYEVKKAQRENIQTVISSDSSEIESFYKTQLEVATRQKFVPFSYDFLSKQFQAFLADDQVKLIHAYKDGKLLASAFIIFYGHEAVYHYGISTPENGKLPGSYACQWAAILEAKKRGMSRYNFWGVNPKDETEHRFAGVGLFKRGFGGEEVEYLPAYDYAFSWKYQLVRLFESLRKKRRKL